MSAPRIATVERKTKESEVLVKLNLDGTGVIAVSYTHLTLPTIYSV